MFWLLCGVLLILFLYNYYVRTVRFFKRHNVKYDVGLLPFGTYYRRLFKIESWRVTLRKLYYEYPDEPFIGLHEIGGGPSYLIRDPDLVKQITIRDFNYFYDKYYRIDVGTDPLFGAKLSAVDQGKWRRLRTLLTPMFTIQKFKQVLIPSLVETKCDLIEYLMERCDVERDQTISIDINELSTRSGIDSFCRAALGIKTDSLRRQDDGFYEFGAAYCKHHGSLDGFKLFGIVTLPRLMKSVFGITMTTPDFNAFIRGIFTHIADTRIARNIQRNDYLQLVQALREKTSTDGNDDSTTNNDAVRYTEAEAVAQCYEFFESIITENNLITNYVAQQLAINETVQNRFFEEFTDIDRNGQSIEYESLNAMRYMEMVTDEALRLCPITTELKRRATKSYVLEGKNGVRVPLKPGDAIWIPMYSLQTDEKYFPNAMHFVPERFSDENKKKHVSGAYAPFGMGPRDCIGCRYTVMELKITFYLLCRKFKFSSQDESGKVIKLQLRS